MAQAVEARRFNLNSLQSHSPALVRTNKLRRYLGDGAKRRRVNYLVWRVRVAMGFPLSYCYSPLATASDGTWLRKCGGSAQGMSGKVMFPRLGSA